MISANNRGIIVTAMKRLEAMGASYFILDLRDNLGGLVQVFKMVLYVFYCLILHSLLNEECLLLHAFLYNVLLLPTKIFLIGDSQVEVKL